MYQYFFVALACGTHKQPTARGNNHARPVVVDKHAALEALMQQEGKRAIGEGGGAGAGKGK